VLASTDGFVGADFPGGTVEPRGLPPGQMSTVEYCRPDGVPLAMDLYLPTIEARVGPVAPVAVYAHGGGPWGDHKGVPRMRGLRPLIALVESGALAIDVAVGTVDLISGNNPYITPPIVADFSRCAGDADRRRLSER
jgi:hypothetical protein